MNNFYFYRLENSTKHVFLAWDEDNAFWGPEFPITHASRGQRADAQGDGGAASCATQYDAVLDEAIAARPRNPPARTGSPGSRSKSGGSSI